MIVQEKGSPKQASGSEFELMAALGKELDSFGRVTPILYSTSDVAFRAAVAMGRVKPPPPNPKPHDLVVAAKALDATYILIVQAQPGNNKMKGTATLYFEGRENWKDDETVSVATGGELDVTDTLRSLARTFVLKMNQGPLLGLPDRPKMSQPPMQPGQEPPVAHVNPGAGGPVTDDALQKSVGDLVKANKSDDAILLLRDAVDSAPLDLARRMSLIELLQVKDPSAAAEEARRAAMVLPDKLELRVLAARCWMSAGQTAEAQKDLNEAVARDPNGPATRMLLGELSLKQLQPDQALPHFDAVVKLQDSAQARFLRALCHALLGGADAMQADLAEAAKLESSPSTTVIASRYALTADLMDRITAKDAVALRELIAKLIVKPKDATLRGQAAQSLRLLQTRVAFLSAVQVPPDAKDANDRRILAHRLLAQCVLDMQTYANSPDEDTLADAQSNLADALKTLAALSSAAKY